MELNVATASGDEKGLYTVDTCRRCWSARAAGSLDGNAKS
jgi:hypothetical protein